MTKKMDQFLRHWICGGVLFGQGPSSSAEGRMVVVHDTKEVGVRQKEKQEDKRWKRRKWSEWRSQRDHSPCAWNIRMTTARTNTQTWATVYVHYEEDSQSTTTLSDNKKERLRKRRIYNAWWLMHWHRLRSRSQVPQVLQVTSHIVGFRSVLRVVHIVSCHCNNFLNFWLVREFFVEFALRKWVFWGVIFTHRVGYNGTSSAVNDPIATKI